MNRRAAFGREWPHKAESFLQGVGQTNGLKGKLELAGFDPADVEDFVDKAKEMAARTDDMADASAL